MRATGTRALHLQLQETILAARMGAPSTINLITPHALLALPLHPSRLMTTLTRLGLLQPALTTEDQEPSQGKLAP